MKLENNWQQKSLEMLEKKNIGFPKNENSRLVNEVLRLRKIPLNQFTIEDIRLMIGQNEGLGYIIVLAINALKIDLFAEGDMYPGDILKNVLNIKPTFWLEHKESWIAINNLIKNKIHLIQEHNISTEIFYSALN